ncbi:MAG: peptidoglycan-binding protein [Patescibacteria group bacterium]|mgnify:CR=1 FL=1
MFGNIRRYDRFPCRALLLVFALGFLLLTNNAHAAPLTYSADITISLTSPAIDFIVKSGSFADTLTTNATSAIVTLSSSTGGNFTLISASRDISIATSSSGGVVTTSCTSGVASTTISQTNGSSVYTISAAASQCTASTTASSLTATPSVTIGVPPYTPPCDTLPPGTHVPCLVSLTNPLAVPRVLSLEDQLANPSAILESMRREANRRGIIPTDTSRQSFSWISRNLTIGSSGKDVQELQAFLIGQQKGRYALTLRKIGASGYFGVATQRALQEFQAFHNIKPARGYFGPKTIKYLRTFFDQ